MLVYQAQIRISNEDVALWLYGIYFKTTREE
jgi:hypothetical protein